MDVFSGEKRWNAMETRAKRAPSRRRCGALTHGSAEERRSSSPATKNMRERWAVIAECNRLPAIAAAAPDLKLMIFEVITPNEQRSGRTC
jgi:hypothetical protein